MRMPNGYGSVVKLSGKRRKPWAVKTSYLEAQPDGTVIRKRRYLAYFTKQEAALTYLADINSGNVVPEHMKYAEAPTFKEMYVMWKKYRNGLKNKITDSTWKNYDIAFNLFLALHDRKIISIKSQELQECLNLNNTKSRATIGSMRTILKGMWNYAIANEYTESNLPATLVFEWTDAEAPVHTRWTDSEIALLWESLDNINNVDILLIYIYTGMRPTELLEIKSEDVHLKERYMIGGIKTEAGRNRIIPIHECIVPLVESRLARNREYLITNKYGNHYTRGTYVNGNFSTVMEKLNLHHAPHDGRYTFASLADEAGMDRICKKIIMGHAVSNKNGTAWKIGGTGDVTDNIYTEKTIEQLVSAVNMIQKKDLFEDKKAE